MRLWKLLTAVLLAFAAIGGSAQAARLFLTTNPGPLAAAEVGGVPVINATDGGEYDVHVWMLPDPDQRVTGASWNIATNNPALVSAVAGSSVVDNPANSNGLTRWTSPVNVGALNGTVDPDGAGGPLPAENTLVANARGAVLLGNGQGIGSLAVHLGDPGRDPSGAFHLGSLRVRTTGNSGTAGLYLRIGQNLFSFQNGAGAAFPNPTVSFGDSTVVYTPSAATRNRGDDMTQDNAEADLIIQFGGPPVRTELIMRTVDPANDGPIVDFGTGPNGASPEFRSFPPGTTHGRALVQGNIHSFFDVFVDLNVEGQALADVAAALQAQEGSDGLTAIRILPDGPNILGLPQDYDLHLTYSAVAGADQTIDFDFRSMPGVELNNIAIPEPSTWALAGLGLLGLAVARRRRAA